MVINSLLNCMNSGLSCNKCISKLPMSDTNATPMPLNPSPFATIKLWAAESLPSRTTLVVRHLLYDQLCHRHNHGSCWCWSRFSTLPPVDPITRNLVMGRSWMFPFEFHQEFDAHIRQKFCLIAAVRIRQSSERKHPETAVGNMQHFQEQDLDWVDVEWIQQQQLVSSTWQVFHSCVYKSHVQDALSWWKTDELGAFLIGRGKRTKHIISLFQLMRLIMREEPDSGWVLWTIAANHSPRMGAESWIFCMSSWDNRCVTTIL